MMTMARMTMVMMMRTTMVTMMQVERLLAWVVLMLLHQLTKKKTIMRTIVPSNPGEKDGAGD